MAKLEGIDKWANQIERSEKRHLERVRGLRRDILGDETLDPLDRAVLGMTGSREELERYRSLAEVVGESLMQPIVVVEGFRHPRDEDSGEQATLVGQARAGIIAGNLTATVSSSRLRPEDPASYSAQISVPVSPIASYMWGEVNYGSRVHEHYFINKEVTGHQDFGGTIDIARFSHSEYCNRGTNPMDDVRGLDSDEDILIGSEVIYSYDHFQDPGVSGLLVRLEAQARLQAAGE